MTTLTTRARRSEASDTNPLKSGAGSFFSSTSAVWRSAGTGILRRLTARSVTALRSRATAALSRAASPASKAVPAARALSTIDAGTGNPSPLLRTISVEPSIALRGPTARLSSSLSTVAQSHAAAARSKCLHEAIQERGTPDDLDASLTRAGELRTAEAKGAEPTYQGYVPDSEEGLEKAPQLFREAYDYHRTPRGQHPRSENKMLVESIDRLAQYDSYAKITMLSPRPLLMIAGTDADTRYFSEEAVAKASDPKELYLIDGATHVGLYDRDEQVGPAITKLAEFFNAHLGARKTTDTDL